jgi:hypothetical protein
MTAGAVGGIVLLSMLVFGGSAVLRARSDAFGHAASAARAGAQVLEDDALARGDIVIDVDGAESAANRYLAAAGAEGTVTVSGADVTVTVADAVAMPMFGNVIAVDATATVSAMRGTP